MASLGDLVVNIKADSSNFKRGTKQATSSMKRFASSIKKIGIATAFAAGAAAVLTLRKQLKELDQVAKTASKLGLLPERLMGLQFAFAQTGVKAEGGAVAIQRMTRRLNDASKASGSPIAKALRAVGLEASELTKLSPDQALSQIADGMNRLDTQAEKVSFAFKLFDTEGVGLVNTLAGGSAGLAEMQAEAEALGATLSTEQLKGIEDVNNEWNRMTAALSGAAGTIVSDMAPAIKDMLTMMVDLAGEAKTTGKWVSQLFNVGGKSTGKTREQLLAQRDAIVASGKFPGGSDNAGFLAGLSGNPPKPDTPPGVDTGSGKNKRGLFDRIAGSKQMIKLQQDLLKVKLAIEEADEKAKRATEAQIALDNMRKGEEVAAARQRVADANAGTGGTGFAGIAQRGSVQALQAITRSAGPGKQQLDEQKKANAILQQLLDEQRADKVAEFTAEGAV